jgi:hypothetical protein
MNPTIFCEACGRILDAVPKRKRLTILCHECRKYAEFDRWGYIVDHRKIRLHPTEEKTETGKEWQL